MVVPRTDLVLVLNALIKDPDSTDSVRVGIGPEVALSARESSNPAKFSIGPAIGFVDRISSDFKFGVFNQNIFGDGFAQTRLQPIVSYQFGSAWSLAAGDLQFTYDWTKRHWTMVPLGAQLGVVAAIAKQQIQLSLSLQYNLRQLPDSERVKIVFGFALLAPEV